MLNGGDGYCSDGGGNYGRCCRVSVGDAVPLLVFTIDDVAMVVAVLVLRAVSWRQWWVW